MLVQGGTVRGMQTNHLRQWSVLAILCVAQQILFCRAYKLGFVIKLREEFPEGYHDLKVVAKILEKRAHQVEIKSVNIPGTDWRALVTEDDLVTPKYDAILTSGLSAASLTGTTIQQDSISSTGNHHCHCVEWPLSLLSCHSSHLQ